MSFRDLERETITEFVRGAVETGALSGRVLDYGCGTQPYRDIILEGTESYVPFDSVTFPGSVVSRDASWPPDPNNGTYDSILCTQVIQYVPEPLLMLIELRNLLKSGGRLVMTGPTNWPVVEREDLHRFTVTGVERLLSAAGFVNWQVGERASIEVEREWWQIGWKAVAWKATL